MSTQIESVDGRTAPEETLEALHELFLVHDDEMFPMDPPVPVAKRLADWRHPFETEPLLQWALWKGPEVVATSGVHMDLVQNLENVSAWVYVHPQQRRSGYGRAIVTPMLDLAEDDGRTRIAFSINEGRSEEELMRRGGLKAALREKLSRLDFQQLDWELMESWVARASERASDYELLYIPSPVPDEYLEAFCELMFVMNTAPLEDYEENDEVMTPEVWRDIEAKMALRGTDLLSYVARHEPSGALAGYTTVSHNWLQPDLVHQWDTGVDPKHRNKGLGRWVKAAMALMLRELYPHVERIDTENAGSNAPMLGINVEMGFKPILIQNLWQGNLKVMRDRLSV